MLNRLWVKLTFAFLAIALVAVGVIAWLSVQATGEEFRQYIVRADMSGQPMLVQGLLTHYQANGSWTGVESVMANLSRSGMGQGMMGRGQGAGQASGMTFMLADASGLVVYDPASQLLGKHLSDAVLARGLSLTSEDGERIGTLLRVQPADVTLDAQGQAFLDRVRRSLVWAGALAAGLALLLGVLVSWRLTAPLRRLTAATAAITTGDLKQRVKVSSGDEIGKLGSTFNRMAASLEAGEALRRNMMADIAHELRTPLTVIQGNLQAILDGVYPLDQAQVAGLYDETRLLTRLVDDLRELALAEAGQLRLEHLTVDLTALARSTAATYTPAAESAGLTLAVEALSGPVTVLGDADRLGQVLRNLLSNALRHTPAGGSVTLRVGRTGDRAELQVADTGAGIAADDLTHVFDRFYRGNKSRSRSGGGTGLGLAITQQLVLAHGGEIGVRSQSGEGATFTVTLPLTETPTP